MKIRNPTDSKYQYSDSYKQFFDCPTDLDEYSRQIIDILIRDAFYSDFSHRDEELQGWLTMASYSSISKRTGLNPRTVHNRIDLLIEKSLIEVVEVYPKVGRSLVSVYRVFFKDSTSATP